MPRFIPLFIAVSLAACGGAATVGTGTTATIVIPTVTTEKPTPPSVLPGSSTSTPSTSVPAGSTLDRMVEAAKSDLSGRLGIDPSDISLLEAGEVTWRNSSRGCPQPGMSYLQVLTPGYLIRLQANGIPYEYHAGSDATPFYCSNPEPPYEGGGGSDV